MRKEAPDGWKKDAEEEEIKKRIKVLKGPTPQMFGNPNKTYFLARDKVKGYKMYLRGKSVHAPDSTPVLYLR